MLLRSGPVPRRIRSERDALDLIAAAVDEHTSALVIVERPVEHGLVVNLSGPVPPDHLERLHGLVLAAVRDEPGCRLLLVSRAAGPVVPPGAAALATWRRLRAHHTGTDTVLLDWFLTDGRDVVSVATAAGAPPSWGVQS
jgi:hypothetical protein